MTNAILTAERLLQTGAVQLSTTKPYTWSSGWKSPIYCDNRKLLSQPFTRDFIKSELCNIFFENFPDGDLVAGVATAGIPWGAMVADQLKLPFIYVRPKPKEHGLGNQIEGMYETGQKAVIIEDLISTGKSSLRVANVLINQGVEVVGMLSIFNYGFDSTEAEFKRAGIQLLSLTNYDALLSLSLQKEMILKDQHEILLKWKEDPANWTGVF
jgi:orotate phosphoribosyltransferase